MSLTLKAAPVATSDWKKSLRAGLVVLVLGIAGFVGWGVAAPLDSAVVAGGTVAVEGSKQIVQHLEGGIVREIDVRDGQLVKGGDRLFLLDDTSARATLTALSTDRAILRAKEARLLAERTLKTDIAFPQDLLSTTNPSIKEALDDEMTSFRRRRELREAQDNVLINRKESLRREIEGLNSEREASEMQTTQIDRELPGLRDLLRKGLIPLSRVTTMERDRSQLEATISRSMTDSAKSLRAIGDADLQIAQSKADWQNTVASDLIDTRRQMAEIGERIKVAQDALSRLEVVSPVNGIAQSRGPSTIGAVVRPGETLVEIAPIDQELVINARISPSDVDVIRLDQKAEVRFPNFKAEESPLMFGEIKALSNDRVTDPTNQKSEYFYARIELQRADLPKEISDRVRAGMNAEIIIPTGERSAMEYLLEPLINKLRVAFRDR